MIYTYRRAYKNRHGGTSSMGAIREIKQKYFGEGDLEAFFGLFGDVFSKIAAIIGVLYFAEGFPADIVMGKILPGIGVGSIAGSLIYFWEAYDLGKKEGRTELTAASFGVSPHKSLLGSI